MIRKNPPRISEELAEVIREKTEEYNRHNPYGNPVSQVEVSRFIAEYIASVPPEKLVVRYERYKPNGNKYGIRIIGEFPGAGLSL